MDLNNNDKETKQQQKVIGKVELCDKKISSNINYKKEWIQFSESNGAWELKKWWQPKQGMFMFMIYLCVFELCLYLFVCI